jgi:hypothetical protein
MLHDCFGTILRSNRRGVYEFLCDDCGRPYATLSIRGLKVESRHGAKRDTNRVSLNALKIAIREVEAAGKVRA